MNDITSRIAKVYKIFLNLYPIRVQEEYGEEMASVFCNACEDAAETSEWTVWKLALHEVWDLPGNLIREYAAEMGRNAMNSQSKPGELFTQSILRGIFSFSICFGLVYFVYCLIDSLLNAGNTILQGNSIWNKMYIHPTGLAFGFGAALMGLHYGKRKAWLSALAASIAFILLYRIWLVAYTAYLSSANLEFANSSLVPFVFVTITGILVGGIIGLIQHGWKKAGWFALAGGLGFNIGWILQTLVTYFVMRQCPYTGVMNQLIVGDLWYFLYFVLPVTSHGGIVGMCMGIATAGVNKRVLMVNHG